MRNNAVLIAAFTALVALVGMSSLPRIGADRSAASDGKQSSTAPLKGSTTAHQKTATSTACEAIARRLQVFIYPKDFQQVGSDSCIPQGPTLPTGVKFAIATVPNPTSTHLALLFDRAIETIQQAAEDENYSYDSSWFPWNDASNAYPLWDDQSKAQAEQDTTEAQPGILVFRGSIKTGAPYESGLVVLLVAESPTGGIDRSQFSNSMTLVERLGGLTNGQDLKVLGTMFSGSVPSLEQALRTYKDLHHDFRVSVFSGSVSSEDSYGWMVNRLDSYGSFKTAMVSDGEMIRDFLSYIEKQGYPSACVAIISEDETAFGNDQTTPENKNSSESKSSTSDEQGFENQERCDLFGQNTKPIYLYYPRDIATLRSAYERQSIFNSKQQSQNAASPSTTLRNDLSEPEGGNHDTVRSYSGQLTPLAQEALLQNTARVLKEKAIEFIVLRSTNSLDQVFLAEFLRRSNPEARVVLDGSDLLFKRGTEGASLRGVMILSAYPLLTPWQEDWTVGLRYSKNGSYRIFGEDIVEGLYVAAREQFHACGEDGDGHQPTEKATARLDCNDAQTAKTNGSNVPINDYGPPQWPRLNSSNETSQRPGTWLSVISHRQFWPMVFLDSARDEDIPAPTDPRKDPRVPSDEITHSPFRFPIEFILLFALGIAWSACNLRWCWSGSILPASSSLGTTYFSPMLRPQHPALIAFGCLLPALLAIVTGASGGLFGIGLDCYRRLVFALWFVAVLAMCIVACLRNYSLPICSRTNRASSRAKYSRWIAGASATVVLIGMAMLHLGFVIQLSPHNEIPTYWRAIHLVNGASPLTPQLLLFVGLYLWFWYSLRGLALFGPDRPLLPKDASLPPLMRVFGRTHVSKWIERVAIPGRKTYFISLGIAVVITLIAFTFSMESFALRTLGERAFGIYMFVWFALCVAVILADVFQLWITWRHLLQLLRRLDRLPLRRTLASMKGLSWTSVWAMSGNVLEDRYCLISRQLESLTHLHNSITESGEITPEAKTQTLRQLLRCQQKGRAFANWYVTVCTAQGVKRTDARIGDNTIDASSTNVTPLAAFQKSLAETAAYLLRTVLLAAWQSESKSLIVAGEERSDKNSTSKQTPDQAGKHDSADTTSVSKDKLPQYVAAAEEFVALPFVAFIQNVLGRIRTIVLGSLCLFVALTFAASSYPFDPLPILGAIFLTLFIIAGGTSMLVLAQMHRDSTLSYITNTQPGELGTQFWIHLITFGVGPLIGLLTTLFPSLTDFVGSWLQLGTQSLQ